MDTPPHNHPEHTPACDDLQTQLADLEAKLTAQTLLTNDLHRQVKYLTIISDATKLFGMVYADLDALLATATQYLAAHIGDLCIARLFAMDHTAILPSIVAHCDKPSEQRSTAISRSLDPLNPVVFAQVLQTDSPLLIAETSAENLRANTTAPYAEALEQLGINSLMLLPLHERGVPIGLLLMGRTLPDSPAYTETDLTIMCDLAEQVSQAITRIRAVTEERRTRALLDTLFATAPIGLGFVDSELRFQHINATLAEINGPSPEEHLGRHIDAVLPELAPTLKPLFRQVLTSGTPIKDLEVQGSTPAAPSVLRTWLVNYYPIFGSDQVIIGVGIVVLEITERKQAAVELSRQAEMLRRQSEILNFAHVLMRDLDNRIVFWNQGASTLYGWEREEALGQVSHHLLQTRHPIAPELILQALLEHQVWEGELTHIRKDGSEVTVASHQVLYRDPDGRPLYVLEVNNDITALKQAEAELRRSAERLHTLHIIDRAILSAQTPEQIAAVMLQRLRQFIAFDGAVVLHYDQEQQQFQVLSTTEPADSGYQPGDLIAVQPKDLDLPFALNRPWYSLDLDLVSRHTTRILNWDALATHSLMHIPLGTADELIGAIRLGRSTTDAFSEVDMEIVMEVADQMAIGLRSAMLRTQIDQERALLAQRVAERTAELSLANMELARAVRLKDDFLANMSHELRTPLNAILARSELLREQIYGPLTGRQDAALQDVEEAGQHLLTLINDILDLSKMEAGMLALEIEPIAVAELSRAAVRMVAQAAMQRRITITTTYDHMVEYVDADLRRLKQILVNLLSNAVKFTPSGGKIGLEVSGDPEQQTVTFLIWDTGIGIAPDEQQQLFRPFVQIDSALNRQHNGTGLGLALVQRLTELHGGSVQLESTVGQGSRFSIVLPWAPSRLPNPQPLPVPPLPVSAVLRRAMVIDDATSALDQIRYYLHELGSRVIVYNRAEGALEQVALLNPDIIVLDILLAEDSGWGLLQLLKADPRTQSIPILMVSVVDTIERSLELGATALLQKPFGREDFLGALQRMGISSVEQPAVTTSLLVTPQVQPDLPLVLLAEDNPANVQVMIDYLTIAGYSAAVASNGVEAVIQAEALRPHLILMDIQMPVLDGLEAIRRIRAAGMRDVPIVALTALAMPGDRERCLAAGADDYLSKPVSLRTLRDVVARLLREG